MFMGFDSGRFDSGRFAFSHVGMTVEAFVGIYGHLAHQEVGEMMKTEGGLAAIPVDKLLEKKQWGTALHAAALSRDNDTLQAMLKVFPEEGMLETDGAGQTALHAACTYAYAADTVELLLERMPDEAFSLTSTNGVLPFHVACGRPLFDAVMERTPKELHAVRTSTGANILHFAVAQRSATLVETLLSSLPESSQLEADGKGHSPLMKAIVTDCDSNVLMAFIKSATPAVLSQKCLQGYLPLEAYLQQPMNAVLPLMLLIDRYEEYGLLDLCKHNPLHLACSSSSQESVDRIARLNNAKEWASTPVNGTLAILALLSRGLDGTGAKKDIAAVAAVTPCEGLYRPCTFTGATPLHYAVQKNSDAVGILLQRLPPHAVEIEDKEGHTPLTRCLVSHDTARPSQVLEIVTTILDFSGGQLSLHPRHWGLLKLHPIPPAVLVELVTRTPPEIFHEDNRKAWEDSFFTPLHVPFVLGRNRTHAFGPPAALSSIYTAEHFEAILNIVPHWFLTVKDCHGNTPLHLAVQRHSIAAVELFMEMREAGEAVLIQPTPLETAVKLSSLEIVTLLVGMGPPGLKFVPMSDGRSLLEVNDAIAEQSPHQRAAAEAIRSVLHPAPKSAHD